MALRLIISSPATRSQQRAECRNRVIRQQKSAGTFDEQKKLYEEGEDRGIYRLLSDEEKAIFKKAVDDDLDIIYRDEFTLFQLKKTLG